jgi:hypothetical protein
MTRRIFGGEAEEEEECGDARTDCRAFWRLKLRLELAAPWRKAVASERESFMMTVTVA